jgi:hypothetical protein
MILFLNVVKNPKNSVSEMLSFVVDFQQAISLISSN